MTASDVLPAVSPAPVVRVADTACHTLIVTVQDGGHALTRIAATLTNHAVRSLSFRAAADGGPALCEIVVPAADSPRAQAKLLRCVEVVGLTARPAWDRPVG